MKRLRKAVTLFLLVCILLTVILSLGGCGNISVPFTEQGDEKDNEKTNKSAEQGDEENNFSKKEPFARALRVILKKDTPEYENCLKLRVENLGVENISSFDFYFGYLGNGVSLICKLKETDVDKVNETIDKLNVLEFVESVELGDENDASLGEITTDASMFFDLSFPKEIDEIDYDDVIYVKEEPIIIITKPVINYQELNINDFPVPNIRYVQEFAHGGKDGKLLMIGITLLDSGQDQLIKTVNELNKIDFIKTVALNLYILPAGN